MRRSTRSRSRLATDTKTERVTHDGCVRTARATIAWFFRSRPTWRTRTGASRRRGAAALPAGRAPLAPGLAALDADGPAMPLGPAAPLVPAFAAGRVTARASA